MHILNEGSYRILTPISENGEMELKMLEGIARTCYKSEDLIDEDDFEKTKKFIKRLVENDHSAMLEHGYVKVYFTTDRAIANELVRHRVASFAQESTRWCNYSKGKFGKQITVVKPSHIPDDPNSGAYLAWYDACYIAEERYFTLLDLGMTPETARSVLPNCLKTTLVMTANYREWRHIFKLRCAKNAHPDMQRLMKPLLYELAGYFPPLFEDIKQEINPPNTALMIDVTKLERSN